MKANEIRKKVLAGYNVYWKNTNYKIIKDNIPNAAAAVTEELLPGPKQFENIQKQWENTKNIFK